MTEGPRRPPAGQHCGWQTPGSLSRLAGLVPLSPHSLVRPVAQVKSGTIFDNFLITNDEAYAEEFGNETWGVTKVGAGGMDRLVGIAGC